MLLKSLRSGLLLTALVLSACVATPEQRVRVALSDAGVPDPVAKCMAKKMAAKLSIAQLQELKRLGALAHREPGQKIGTKRILRAAEALGDPEIVSVTSRAAIGCYILG
jgi:hypothetical protein